MTIIFCFWQSQFIFQILSIYNVAVMPVFTHHIDHLFDNPKAVKSLHQDHEALCCNNYGCFCDFGNSKPRWKFDRNRTWCLQILWFVKLYKWKSMQTEKNQNSFLSGFANQYLFLASFTFMAAMSCEIWLQLRSVKTVVLLIECDKFCSH